MATRKRLSVSDGEPKTREGGRQGRTTSTGGAKKYPSQRRPVETETESDQSAKERSRKIVWKFELLLKLRPEMTPTQPTVQRQWSQQTDIERDRDKLNERVRECTTRMPVVVLNKMFAGAISVNSVVLCLLIQLLLQPPPHHCHCHCHSGA